MNYVKTIWALLPPVIAIIFALKTKEVYISLLIGVVSGTLLLTNFHLVESLNLLFDTVVNCLSKPSNIGILIFLVMLGIIVTLMTKSGGSQAYGKWAKKKMKSSKQSLFSTFILGVVIFVDDYFNCLTVGSVMREITDEFKVSRAMLAYIIDSTAAPVCIIAPISSWAAAVSGYTSGDGFQLFLNTIPFNLYALLTIVMVCYVIGSEFHFGKMKKHELAAQNGDVCFGDDSYQTNEEISYNQKGKVLDLILPVIVLIMSCIIGMIYTGGFFDGKDLITAFSQCDASRGLVYGTFVTLVFVFILYIPRKIISYNEFVECIPEGFKAMVPSILILVLAWSLGDLVSNQLQAGAFVYNTLQSASISTAILPACLFIVGAGLSFSTGTSWGTFGILIPMATSLFPEGSTMLVISIASILAGAVCGDHISPISDTTIMASTGAKCNHLYHVTTQIPYALVVASACFIGYLVAGFTQNLLLTLLSAFGSLFIIIFMIRLYQKRKV
ncbi:Na+/H+ antiporter NhaC family protein [Coprobacillus sp. AM23-9LB]|jgi:tetracycline resistance efflux pump|uniref:Na+/H+ antiporter NhaC family protein n=1 Tax=Faecalibacillus intestinalis TaxID=1982626 RepID=UPI000E422A09|nr:Na+/H+ antiporter NhaC family protein [Faecalibacillus intestinalis]RGE93696.1 Na+/H+ antiporter NhaC family protein [Coprobacillus sp. AM23-9LB]